ncbi:hypothetical protein [Amylibacter sp. IMCC11727]|uniref:hypothetical protein n=1 Tax=Amylibacter sp. IMCC11727 TaxID=3039851 RepID=UPI00244DD050|nr:hypothetical protein [Amylibacter sp. IMCC11727]WGI23169.1 hypothetical protein QBD29_07040 [Amylibacter sp. IMCC11727]
MIAPLTRLTAVAALLGTAACVDQSAYETAPVAVTTEQGVVTCQLYTQRHVLWDRATHVPAGMTIERGDEICRQEGERRN